MAKKQHKFEMYEGDAFKVERPLAKLTGYYSLILNEWAIRNLLKIEKRPDWDTDQKYYAQFGYDKENKIIGFKVLTKKVVGCRIMAGLPKLNSCQISLRRFFEFFKIDYIKYIGIYDLKQEGEFFYFKLKPQKG